MSKLSRVLTLALLIGLMSSSFACDTFDTGAVCSVTNPDPSSTFLSVTSLECRSRVCVQLGGSNAAPACSTVCEEDSDCPTLEAFDNLPERKFVCRVLQTTGPQRCCKFCVAEADLTDPADKKNENFCTQENIAPVCPSF